ncbi:MAG: hypothetical protein Q6363_005440 [Candidatus Njordarchaeota archaeon]
MTRKDVYREAAYPKHIMPRSPRGEFRIPIRIATDVMRQEHSLYFGLWCFSLTFRHYGDAVVHHLLEVIRNFYANITKNSIL